MYQIYNYISTGISSALTRLASVAAAFSATLSNLFNNRDSSTHTDTDRGNAGSSELVTTHNFILNAGFIFASSSFLYASNIFLNRGSISANTIIIRSTAASSDEDDFIDASHIPFENITVRGNFRFSGNVILSAESIIISNANIYAYIALTTGHINTTTITGTFFSQRIQQQNTHQPSPELILTSTNQDKLDALGIPKEFIPPEFICPIKKGIMDKAVYDPSFQHRYEEAYLGDWLNRSNQNPMTRTPLNFSQLKEDTFLQYKINLFVDAMEKEGERLLAMPKAEAMVELEKILAIIHQKAIAAFSIIPYTGARHSILFAPNQTEAQISFSPPEAGRRCP